MVLKFLEQWNMLKVLSWTIKKKDYIEEPTWYALVKVI